MVFFCLFKVGVIYFWFVRSLFGDVKLGKQEFFFKLNIVVIIKILGVIQNMNILYQIIKRIMSKKGKDVNLFIEFIVYYMWLRNIY